MATEGLADMGPTPGTRTELLGKAFLGLLDIEISDSKLVFRRDVVATILVERPGS